MQGLHKPYASYPTKAWSKILQSTTVLEYPNGARSFFERIDGCNFCLIGLI